jgi:methylenetetrahydrofolate--tRNA-(uracil-5-)-methyltransferase
MTDPDVLPRAVVVGAGLAGCEAAYQLARHGVPVLLLEMKPGRRTPAHHADTFAELVCSNSLRSDRLENAVGLLKQEMRTFGSLILAAADHCRVPAGGALAVDREGFTETVTRALRAQPRVEIREAFVESIPGGPCIVATGPLTEGPLAEDIARFLGSGSLHFFDAAAPIVSADSIDRSIAFRASRYGKGGDDYLNCPMDEAEYLAFHQALVEAETADIHDFDKGAVFEGCMPIETMAGRGVDTIRFGPLKPVGLVDPRTGRTPYAVVQLRQDDAAGSLYNLVGFQTRLRQKEQVRVLRMIPGLAQAEFQRFGAMHRNTYLPSPGRLAADYSATGPLLPVPRPTLYFAGQMTGVEGYVESASSGLLAGVNLARRLLGREPFLPPASTVIGALSAYVSDERVRSFDPMNANFGLVRAPEGRFRKKEDKVRATLEASLAVTTELAAGLPPFRSPVDAL